MCPQLLQTLRETSAFSTIITQGMKASFQEQKAAVSREAEVEVSLRVSALHLSRTLGCTLPPPCRHPGSVCLFPCSRCLTLPSTCHLHQARALSLLKAQQGLEASGAPMTRVVGTFTLLTGSCSGSSRGGNIYVCPARCQEVGQTQEISKQQHTNRSLFCAAAVPARCSTACSEYQVGHQEGAPSPECRRAAAAGCARAPRSEGP